jgi:YidC/Oxa1 family membrane protein insertase
MWDALIVNPMTNALLLFYSVVGNNFVVAIAIFTILIRLATLPLNLRQQRSSMKMQAMQPQIQAIQKKYKDNPAKMQEEFQKIGYNPAEMLTGCLPLLLQFPILIGLYQAIIQLLGSTPQALFELTDRVYPSIANWVELASLLPIENTFLWMNLAQPDPYFVLPVLVFITMYAQQKVMMPAQSQQNQQDNPMAGMTQSMLYTMPIMFGFFSLQFPAGLSVYFVLANIIGIGQGFLTLKTMPKPGEQAATAVATNDVSEDEDENETATKPVKRSAKRKKRKH